MKYLSFILFLLMAMTLSTIHAAVIEGCLVDECTGEQFANATFSIDIEGIGSDRRHVTITIETDEEGCFSVNTPEEFLNTRVYIRAFGETYVERLTSRLVLDLGSLPVPNFSSPLLIRNGNDGSEQAPWESSPCAASVFRIGSCNDPYLVYKGGATSGNTDESTCVRLTIEEICGIVPSALVYTTGWIPADPNRAEYAFRVKNMFEGYDFQRDYPTVEVIWEVICCDDLESDDPTILHREVDHLRYEEGAPIGSADFQWMASDGVEAINGEPQPYDGVIPNDGSIKTLGYFSLGVNGSISITSGQIPGNTILRIYRMADDCSFPDQVIFEEVRSGASAPNNFLFNTQQINGQFFYFFNEFGSDYDDNSCFMFEIEVTSNDGNYVCSRSILQSGLFRVTNNCGGCRLSNGSVENSSIVLFPNPSEGDFWINVESDFIQSITVFDATGRVVRHQRDDNRISLSDNANGLYVIQLMDIHGVRHQHKVIKQ